jgi:hypothetical protein
LVDVHSIRIVVKHHIIKENLVVAMKEVIGFPDGLPDLEGTGDRLKQPLPLIEAEKQRRPSPTASRMEKEKEKKTLPFRDNPHPRSRIL